MTIGTAMAGIVLPHAVAGIRVSHPSAALGSMRPAPYFSRIAELWERYGPRLWSGPDGGGPASA